MGSDIELFGKTPEDIEEDIEENTGTEEDSENESESDIAANISPIKAIRLKCLDCSCWQRNEVRLCTCTKCPLYPFRFGKNPFINRKKKEYTDEERKAIGERLQSNRAYKKKKIKEMGKKN